MFVRVVSALIGIPLLIFVITKGNLILIFSVLIVSLIGLKEFYDSFNKIEIYPLKKISYIFTVTLFLVLLCNKQDLLQLNFYLITILLLITNLFSKKNYLIASGITLLGYFYVPFSLLHIVLLSYNFNVLVWLVFIIAWSTDTFAYFSGYFFGSKKLLPSVSPKKTVEGSIGGIIGSILLTSIYSYIIIPEFIFHSVILGFFGSILSQIGDLMASKIKRYVGIKDFGNLMPGHGGILDRFDSILILVPFIYYYILIFFNK